MSLDDLIARSAPAVTPPSTELTETFHELIAGNRAAARPRRRPGARVWAAGSLALVGVFGVGGVAAANGLLPGWFPWAAESGSSCSLQVSVELRRDGDGALITDRVSEAEQRSTLTSAQKYLTTLDVSAIDRKQAADRWFAYLEKVSPDHPHRAELESKFQGERLETHAVLHEAETRLDDYLTAHGHDPRSIMTSLANECDR
jgi:hypothetical protein